MSRLLREAKDRKKLTYEDLAKTVGMSEVYIASVLYGESAATEEVATKIAQALDLDESVKQAMIKFPVRGNSVGQRTIPTDPCLYRFYEVLAVYGLSLKDVIQEKFGDGIMSAVDIKLDVKREGDRVVVTLDGKFLPYRRW